MHFFKQRPEAKTSATLVVIALLCAAWIQGDSVLHEPREFSIHWPVGLGNSVYVAGSAQELGNWNPVDAVKLRFAGGDVWQGRINLPRESAVEYKFISRDDTQNAHCNVSNVVWSAKRAVTCGISQPATKRRPDVVLQVTSTGASGCAAEIASIKARADVSSPLLAPCTQMAPGVPVPPPNRSVKSLQASTPRTTRHNKAAVTKGITSVRIKR